MEKVKKIELKPNKESELKPKFRQNGAKKSQAESKMDVSYDNLPQLVTYVISVSKVESDSCHWTPASATSFRRRTTLTTGTF